MNNQGKDRTANVAIIDYGMGNMFSIKHACEAVRLAATVTNSAKDIMAADAVILPGVGAFGDAMDILSKLDLITPIRDFAVSGKLLMGICLGQQLLMSESCEFGTHEGLGILPGTVEHFGSIRLENKALKVPHVGWNRIYPDREIALQITEPQGELFSPNWEETPLARIPIGAYMYFVHSYHVVPEDDSVVLSYSAYGNRIFCSSLRRGNVMGFQFHPERSGQHGLDIYRAIATVILK